MWAPTTLNRALVLILGSPFAEGLELDARTHLPVMSRTKAKLHDSYWAITEFESTNLNLCSHGPPIKMLVILGILVTFEAAASIEGCPARD
ncbi:hypothetical protein GCM10027073_74210 [Streptomyces chlorus]